MCWYKTIQISTQRGKINVKICLPKDDELNVKYLPWTDAICVCVCGRGTLNTLSLKSQIHLSLQQESFCVGVLAILNYNECSLNYL